MLKNRIKKLEARKGARKMYVFEMKDGLDSGVIAAQFCEENDIDRDEGNLFIFIRRFGYTAQDWKFLYQTAI